MWSVKETQLLGSRFSLGKTAAHISICQVSPIKLNSAKVKFKAELIFLPAAGQTTHSAPLRVGVRRSQPELTQQWPRGLSQDASSRTGEPAPSPPQPGTRIVPKKQGRPAGVTALSGGMRNGLSAPSITEEVQMNWIF